MFLSDTGALLLRTRGRDIALTEPLTDEDRIAALMLRGHSAGVAAAIVGGGMGTRMGVVVVARECRLLARVETGEARDAGLIT